MFPLRRVLWTFGPIKCSIQVTRDQREVHVAGMVREELQSWKLSDPEVFAVGSCELTR